MAVLLYPGGVNAVVEPRDGRSFDLDEKHALVPGATHEIIFLDDSLAMLTSPDCAGLPNANASRFVALYTRKERKIRGRALLFWISEFENAERLHGDYAEAILNRLHIAENPITFGGKR